MDSPQTIHTTVARPDTLSGRAFQGPAYTAEAVAEAALFHRDFAARRIPLVSAEALTNLLLCLAPSLLMLGFLAFFVGTGTALTAKFAQYSELYPQLRKIIKFSTAYGTLFFHAPMLYFFIKAVRQKNRPGVRALLIYLAAQILVAFFVVRALKVITGIPRPHMLYGGDVDPQPFSFDNNYNSFPSGHATEAMGAAGTLAVWFKKTWLTLLCGTWAAYIAFTRIFLCQHSISDILAGLVLGSLTALAVNYYYRRSRT